MAAVKLKPGVTVLVGRKTYKGSIPEEVCPDHLKPKAKKTTVGDESA